MFRRTRWQLLPRVTDVEVGLTQTEVAQEEIKIEEKQRVLGIIPNFYVTYDPNAVPLNSKQKFGLAWKTTVDPFTLVFGGRAGVEQALNSFSGYGQGAQGYAKRLRRQYADLVTGTFIGSAVLPSLLKQDPRYFYKGTGSKRSRTSVCDRQCGDLQGRRRTLAAELLEYPRKPRRGGISNLYYPARDREGAGLTFETGLIGIGTTAAANLFQVSHPEVHPEAASPRSGHTVSAIRPEL